jgi:hypothetical protein
MVLKRAHNDENKIGEKPLEEYVTEWKEKKVRSSVSEIECDFFFTKASRMVRNLYFCVGYQVLFIFFGMICISDEKPLFRFLHDDTKRKSKQMKLL